jgi:DNA-binding response OmpR family regulator
MNSHFALCVNTKNRVVAMIPGNKDAPNSKLTVMVVEDNAQFRQLVSDFLAFAGYAVIPAVNGIEALTLLQQTGSIPDLIVTDIIMGNMNGCQFFHTVRQQWEKMPFIMMSTSTTYELSCPDSDLKPDAYITKPFPYEELIKTIHAVLFSAGTA